MQKHEAAAYIAGLTPSENASESQTTNVHIITATVEQDSDEGTALVSVEGMVFGESDDQYFEVDTIGGLLEGDTTSLILTGEPGHGMTPLSLGGVGTVDRVVKRVSEIEADYVQAGYLEANYAHIHEGVIDNAHINDANIVDGSITGAKIRDGEITGSKIAGATITGSNIANGTITSTQISDSGITGSKIDASTFTNGQISGSKIDSSTLTNIPFASISNADVEVANIANTEIGKATIKQAQVENLSTDYAHLTQGVIDNAKIDHADVNGLSANYATIANLNAATARIGDLEADHVSVDDFEAEQGYIDDLQAATADIATIRADSAKVHSLTAAQISAATGYVGSLTAGNVSAQDIVADHATVGALDTNYAQIDMANVNNAWINNGAIKNGAISDAMINSVSANKLTAGTIDASNITVTNLNADNITTGTINGQRIGEGSLSLSKLEDDVYTEAEVDAKLSMMQSQIDGAIETWTGTDVPTLQNSPASSWNTTALKDSHVGDVYFVVNSQSQQNGYNYRFTKSGSTYSWQLIKDSDVTNALQRLTTAEGQITTFDSDISQLKTDTGTLTTKTTSLETRMSDAEADILDKVDTTTFNEVSDTVDSHSQSITQMTTTLSNKADSSTVSAVTQRVSKNEQDISGINTTIGTLTTTVESKADGSTVETMSTKLNNVETTVNGHTQSISSINSTLANKADSSTVSTLTTKVNNVSDTVDGHTSQLSSITQTQTSIQQNAVKSTVQLWFTKADTTAPAKPTAHVTTNNAATGNAWNLAVPSYNSAYPNYYYCYEYQYVDGSYGWSAVTRDIATGETQATARQAQDDIDNLEIGGRNLLKGRSAVNSATANGLTVDYDSVTHWMHIYGTNTKTDAAWALIGFSTTVTQELVVGDEYTLTMYSDDYETVKEQVYIQCNYCRENGTQASYVGINHTPGHYPSITEKCPSDYVYHDAFLNVFVGIRPTARDIDVTFRLKLEKGNRATDWTPAPEDVDADISTAQTSADNAQATADKNVKESQQLWFTKANGSAPNKPTSKVTSTSTSGNAWTTKVPTYSSSYPYYFYCMQYIAADGTVTWSDVVYDQATTEAQSVARTTSASLSTLQSDYATFKQTTQNFESTIGTTYATKTELQTTDNKIENLEIGGRNLLPSSIFTDKGITGSTKELGPVSLNTMYSYFGNNDRYIFGTFEENTQYTFRVGAIQSAVDNTWVGHGGPQFGFRYTDGTQDDYTTRITFLYKDEAELVYKALVSNPTKSVLNIYVTYGYGHSNWCFYDMKLEKGNKATDWTPAPEDVDAAIDKVDSRTSVRLHLRRDNWSDANWGAYASVGHADNFVNIHVASGGGTSATGFDATTLNIGDLIVIEGISTGTSIPYSATAKVTSVPASATGDIPATVVSANNAKAIESRVSSAETSITQTNNQIALKANASDVYTKTQTDGLISTEVSNRNSAIEQSANAINLSVSQTYTTKTEFNALEVGGRNLLLDTANEKSQAYNSSVLMSWHFAFDVSLPQATYTLSFDMKSSNGTDKFYASIADIQTLSTKQLVASGVVPSTSYSRYFVTFNYTQTAASDGVFITSYTGHGGGTNNGNSGTVYIKNIKLEKGNKPTDWSPAPEDMATTTALESAKSEIQQTTDGITSTVEKISSAKYLTSAYAGWSLTNIKAYGSHDTQTTFRVTSTDGVRVGDTVYIKGTDTTRSCTVYIKGVVKTVSSATSVTVYGRGYEDILPVESIKSTINQSADSVKIEARHVNIEGAAIFSSGRLSETSLNNAYDPKGAAQDAVSGAFDNRVSDSAEFLYRLTADGEDVPSGRATIQTIKGNTLRWNQLVVSPNDGTNWLLASGSCFDKTDNQDGSISLTVVDNTATQGVLRAAAGSNFVSGHKYLAKAGISGHSSNTRFNLLDNWTACGSSIDAIAATSAIVTATENSLTRPYFSTTISRGSMAVGTVITIKHPQLFDLTQMFGAGNEPSTVAEFEALFPEPYYPYDAGSLLPVRMEGIETVGFNQWDEEYLYGQYNAYTGEYEANTIRLCSKYPISIAPNTAYYVYTNASKYNSWIIIVYYDANMNYLSYASPFVNRTFTTPTNAHYMHFNTNDDWRGAAYNHDICINISDPARNGTYEPYWSSERTIPVSTYFPDGMRSAGSVCDELRADAAVTRVGAVDLGTLTWSYASDAGVEAFFATGLPILATGYANNTPAPMVCSKYETVKFYDHQYFVGADKVVAFAYGGGMRLYVKDSTAGTDPAAFKTAMSGVYLFYALATPTTTPIDPPLNFVYKADPSGTERILVDETKDAPQSAPVPMDITYGVNLYEDTIDDVLNISSRVSATEEAISPLASKTYTGIIGTANDANGASFYFGNVYPVAYDGIWKVHLRINVTEPVLYQQSIDIMISGHKSAYMSFDSVVARSSSALAVYFINLYRATQTGINAGVGHALGFNLRASTNPTNTSYKRTISVDVLDVDNCSVKLFDTAVKYDNLPSYNTTNYGTHSTSASLTELGVSTNGQNASNNGNTYDRTYHNNPIKAATAITAGHIICGTSAGYKNIAAGITFDIAYPLLYSPNAIAVNSTRSDTYSLIPSINFSNNGTIQSGVAYAQLYLKGTIVGNTFTIAASPFMTTVVPTTEDGYFYIPMGIMSSVTAGYFESSTAIYAFLDGKFRQVTPTEIVASHRVYYRTGTVNNSLAAPSTWVAEATGNTYNAWTTKVPPLSSGVSSTTKYPYLYTCEQRKRLDGTVECTKVLLDDSNTIIDGGTIITGSIAANKISATSGTFDTANIPNLDAEKITSGTIDAARINASALTINNQTLGVSIGRLNNIVTAGDDEDDVVFTEDALSVLGRNVHISAGNVDISTDESTGNVTSLTDTLGTLATTDQVDELDNSVTNLADNMANVQDYVNPLTSWINITEVPTSGGGTQPALQMGTTDGNAPVMQLTNSMLQFRMLGDANPLLQMGVVDGESLMEIMKAVVLKELRFNNFAFIARPNGNVCLKYIGRD